MLYVYRIFIIDSCNIKYWFHRQLHDLAAAGDMRSFSAALDALSGSAFLPELAFLHPLSVRVTLLLLSHII